MPNIMITSKCNLHCDYCFARDTFSSSDTEISLEMFEKLTRFITNSGEYHIGLIGGEPLLHSQFDKVVDIAMKYTDPGNIILFTNGLLLNREIDVLERSMIKLMINCNGADILGINEDQFYTNLELCANELNWNKSVTLSYNIYRPNQKIDEFISIVDRFPVKTIRVSIASPDQKQRNMLPSEYFETMKDVVTAFFSEMNKRKIRMVMDCNIIPNCIQKDIERTIKYPFVGKMPKSVCRPVLDFGLDGSVMRCFGLSDVRIDISKFQSLAQIYGYFNNMFDAMAYHRPSELKCKDCFERMCMGCMNGCLSFNARRATFLS